MYVKRAARFLLLEDRCELRLPRRDASRKTRLSRVPVGCFSFSHSMRVRALMCRRQSARVRICGERIEVRATQSLE